MTLLKETLFEIRLDTVRLIFNDTVVNYRSVIEIELTLIKS